MQDTKDVCRITFEKCIPHITNFTHAIDVGCRFGQFTQPITEHFVHCWSFDYRSTPEMQQLLQHNDKITYHQGGLSDREETCIAWGGVIVDKRHDVHSKKKTYASLRTLDSYNIDQVGFIKIDVEGHELKVIKGALNTLDCWNPVLCIEQNHSTEKWGKGKEFEALTFLETIGYTVVDTRKWDYIMVRK